MKKIFSLFGQQQNQPTSGSGNGFGGHSPSSPQTLTQNRNIDYVHPTLKSKLRSNEKKYNMRVVIRGDKGSGKTQYVLKRSKVY